MHNLIARNPNNTHLDRIHTSATCFNRAQGHQMSYTLTNMLEGNATVYQATCNPKRSGRDGGRRNGRHRGGRDGDRGTGRRGGRRQNAQPIAAQPTAAVSPPQQYAQAMVMPPPHCSWYGYVTTNGSSSNGLSPPLSLPLSPSWFLKHMGWKRSYYTTINN